MAVALQNLPASIAAVEFSPAGVALYWQEQGNVELLDNLHQQMQVLLASLQSMIREDVTTKSE